MLGVVFPYARLVRTEWFDSGFFWEACSLRVVLERGVAFWQAANLVLMRLVLNSSLAVCLWQSAKGTVVHFWAEEECLNIHPFSHLELRDA